MAPWTSIKSCVRGDRFDAMNKFSLPFDYAKWRDRQPFPEGTADEDLLFNSGRDALNGGPGDDLIIDDIRVELSGNPPAYNGRDPAASRIDGGAGNDFIIAGQGDDTAYGGAGNDTLFGGAVAIEDEGDGWATMRLWGLGSGHDQLYGGPGDDVIHGDNGNDHLYGGTGNDLLLGGRGNDHIDPGSNGNGSTAVDGDFLIGGQGDDTFDLSNAKGTYYILDFGTKDRLELSAAPIPQEVSTPQDALAFSNNLSDGDLTSSLLLEVPGADIYLIGGDASDRYLVSPPDATLEARLGDLADAHIMPGTDRYNGETFAPWGALSVFETRAGADRIDIRHAQPDSVSVVLDFSRRDRLIVDSEFSSVSTGRLNDETIDYLQSKRNRGYDEAILDDSDPTTGIELTFADGESAVLLGVASASDLEFHASGGSQWYELA